MLTADQRWLLRAVGGWAMRDCLLGPAGVQHLMASCYGSTGHALPGGPEWLAGGFSCGHGKIVSPGFGEPVVKVTVAQLNRFAADLPSEVVDELKAVRAAHIARTYRSRRWCLCGREAECHRAHLGDPLYGNRHHPTEAEEQCDRDEYWRLQDWQDEVLDRALGFEVEPVGQLELFGALA